MANLRGFRIIAGQRTKAITKQASAPRLQPPNINNRSHLLTFGMSRQPLSASPEKYEHSPATIAACPTWSVRLADAGGSGTWRNVEKLTHEQTTLLLLLVEFEQGVELQHPQLLEV